MMEVPALHKSMRKLLSSTFSTSTRSWQVVLPQRPYALIKATAASRFSATLDVVPLARYLPRCRYFKPLPDDPRLLTHTPPHMPATLHSPHCTRNHRPALP